jgi:hypothetical protein
MQIEWKRCGGFNRDNFNHKFYMAHNLWEEAPLPFLIIYFVLLCTSAIPKVGVHLGVIKLHPLHSPPFVRMCFTPKHILLASWAFALHV